MSKDKRISRKRFVRLLARKYNSQVRAVGDIVRRELVDPAKRQQEQSQSAAHRKERQK